MPGKRTERLDMPRQLRLDDELARDVRLIADLEGRPIGSQILRWIRSGVESYKASGRQPASGFPAGAGPQAAAVRTSQPRSEEGAA